MAISNRCQVIVAPETAKISHSTDGVSAITPPKSLPIVGQP